MPMTSTPEQPQPLRAVVAATKGWVERLGPVWVSGQLIELRRRAGANTHFLTLRDALAEVSVTVDPETEETSAEVIFWKINDAQTGFENVP